ncbi:MAG: rRNA maturation RNase YbeY [Coxiellaceae bacterium]|nr:rRNA maturation RNase YbeY [Coxiellaceae bacterium]
MMQNLQCMITVELINDIDCDFAPKEATFQQWINAVATHIPTACTDLCITLIDEDESAALNAQYRQKKGPTNVLSFNYEKIPGIVADSLGDLAICAAIVKAEAEAQQKPLESHWAHMTIHGALHLLGYDHIEDNEAEKMEALEIQIMGKLGFKNPY